MNPPEIQKKLFDHIKATLPPHLAVADEISDLLAVSTDSVYRRLRGETLLTIGELQLICKKYNISLDQMLNLQNGSTVFRSTDVTDGSMSYEQYLISVLGQLQYFNQFSKRELFYLTKDIPIFHFFQTREMSAFKSYFWMKSIINTPGLPDKFSLKDDYEKEFQIGQKIITEYNNMPSTELWNVESINSTIHQIEYYRDAGIFASQADIEGVYDAFEKLIFHLKDQCKAGVKFFYGRPAPTQGQDFNFFVNELILGNNTIIAKLEDRILTFITHGVLNFMGTTDFHYGERTLHSFNNLVNRSALISRVGEKERSRFFNELLEEVRYYRNGKK